LVIAAFREFLRTHPQAKLVCVWDSEWPETMETMAASPHLRYPRGFFKNQQDFHRALLVANGIPEKNIEVVPRIFQGQLAEVMRSTDIGVFPNRCEGGTYLVLMEYLACGRPAVATNSTGHRDVLSSANSMALTPRLSAGFWDEPDVLEVASKMELLAQNNTLRLTLGAGAAESMKQWTWERAARTIVEEIFGGC
jgi:glycosyltransferase involved in cell wall biosynthesis